MTEQEILNFCFPIEEEKIGLSMIWEDILKDLKPHPHKYNPNIIYWIKNGKRYFRQYKENKELWCDYHLVWKHFSNKENYNFYETKEIIKNLLLSHDEWKDYFPNWDFYN